MAHILVGLLGIIYLIVSISVILLVFRTVFSMLLSLTIWDGLMACLQGAIAATIAPCKHAISHIDVIFSVLFPSHNCNFMHGIIGGNHSINYGCPM